jgi:hypothetical protein
MRASRQIWFTLVLIALAALVFLIRNHGIFHASGPRITDLSVTSPLNQPGGGAAPADAYDVYSGLYASPLDEPLVLAQDSGADIPQLNGNCLKPSTPEEHQMADAFEAANRHSQRWEARFAIPFSYRVLPAGEFNEAMNCFAAHAQNTPRCASYKDLKHVRILGAPGFDAPHTRALVSVLKKCGPYCGSGGIFEARKESGAWKRADPTAFTSDCSWRY